MRKLCAIAGILALSSLVFYGFTGMTLWAPVTGPANGRTPVLIMIHFFGLAAGFCACVSDFWRK